MLFFIRKELVQVIKPTLWITNTILILYFGLWKHGLPEIVVVLLACSTSVENNYIYTLKVIYINIIQSGQLIAGYRYIGAGYTHETYTHTTHSAEQEVSVCHQKTECSLIHICSWQGMMTSSKGFIFRVTGPLCGEFAGHRWIPLTKASDTELWCFIWSAPE